MWACVILGSTFWLSNSRRSKKIYIFLKLLKIHFVCLLEGIRVKFPYFTEYIIILKWLKTSRVSIFDDFTTLGHELKRILHAGSTNDFRRNHPIFVSRWRKLNPRRAQTILIELRRDVPEKLSDQIALAVCRRISGRSGGAAGDQWVTRGGHTEEEGGSQQQQKRGWHFI